MNNGFKRLLALLLSLVLMFTALPVLVFAEEPTAEESTDSSPTNGTTDSTGAPEGFNLLYDRNFSEGWPLSNGLNVSNKNHHFGLDYERGYDGRYNYFARFTVLGSDDGFAQYSWPTTEAESVVVEFDIKADDYVDYSGYIYYIRTKGGNGPGAVFYLLGVSGNALYYYDYNYKAEQPGDDVPDSETGEPSIVQSLSGSSSRKIVDLTNDWTKVSIMLDYSNGGIRNKEFTCTISWVAPNGTVGSHTQLLRSNISWEVDEDGEYVLDNGACVDTNKLSPKMDFFRIGYAGKPDATSYGTSYCIDNLRIYEGVAEQFMEIDEAWGFKNGQAVNSNAKPTIEIKGNDDITISSTTSIAMKIGVDYCLNNNVREPIFSEKGSDGNDAVYGAPVILDGVVYVPLLKLLEATGLPYYLHEDGQSIDITTGQKASYITVGKDSAMVDGQKIMLTAAPGYYENEDGKAYLAVAMDDIETLLPGWYITYDDLGLIVFCTTDNLYNRDSDLAEMIDLMGRFVFDYKSGEEVYEDAKANTNNFDHPYLLADQDMFDTLRAIYLAKEGDENYNKLIKDGITKSVSSALSKYKVWSKKSGDGSYDTYIGLMTDREIDQYNKNFLGTVSWGNTEINNGTSLYQPYAYDGIAAVQSAVDKGNAYYYALNNGGEIKYEIGGGSWITGYDNNELYGDDPDEMSRYTYNGVTYVIKGHYFTNDAVMYLQPKLDADGNVVYEEVQKVQRDDNGNIVYQKNGQPAYVAKKDADGNDVYDDNGNIVYETEKVIVYETYTTESGATRGYSRCISQNYNGYDPEGGRTNIGNMMGNISAMAFAYQMTRDDKYLLCAYDAFLRLGQWTNWAPGHFLDCATATLNASYFYDWCYDRINELGKAGVTSAVNGKPLSTELLARIIYQNGIYAGYRAVMGLGVGPNSSRKQGNITSFSWQYNNWNAVCSSGMAAGVFALMDYCADDVVCDFGETNPPNDSTDLAGDAQGQILRLFEKCFYGITSVGLDQYAPDGSYSEGVGYWSFGTGRVFVWGSLLETVCGTDYGMFDAPGLDRTCQYAYGASSSDFITFPYSDGSMGRLTYSHFYFVGQKLGQQELIDIRTAQLELYPETLDMYDMFFYPLEAEAKLPDALDYYSRGVDMFTARSSWEQDALYTGVIGGKNKTADHNQIDAGHFIYYNERVTWFIDIGCESYNVYGYGNAEIKYRYYRSKPEGHNTICITTDQTNVPFGQVYDSEARAYEVMTENNPHGSYAKFDMTETLGPKCNYWKRGILLTNDRQTTVIQDEISLREISNLYWFAHFSYAEQVDEYVLEADGKTAYLINYGKQTGQGKSMNEGREDDDIWLRATLVSNSSELKFEVWDAYTYVHSNVSDPSEPGFTHRNNYNPNYYTFVGGESEANGGRHETGRASVRKLVVRGEARLSLEMAVVIEMVDREPEQRYSVGYSWKYMDGSATYGPWAPTEDTRFKADYVKPDENTNPDDRSKIKLSEFRKISEYFTMATNSEYINTYLGHEYENFYYFLATAKYLAVKYKEQIATVDIYKDANGIFLNTIEIFDMYRQEIVSVANSRDAVCEAMLGITIDRGDGQ